MFWLLPLIGGAVGGLIGGLVSAAITEEEKNAARAWEYKKDEVETVLTKERKKIDNHLKFCQSVLDFHQLTEAHYSSVLAANSAYKILKDAEISLAGIGKMIVATKHKKDELYNLRKKSKSKVEREKYNEEFNLVKEYRNSLFIEKDKIKEQRDKMLSEVKSLNSKTHELKLLIKNHCGKKGIEWFNRIEANNIAKRN